MAANQAIIDMQTSVTNSATQIPSMMQTAYNSVFEAAWAFAALLGVVALGAFLVKLGRS